MNEFLLSLDDSDHMTIVKAMDVFYSKMFFLHPSKSLTKDCLIMDVDDYEVATDLKMTLELEKAIVTEGRDDCKSLRERAEMQWFVEQLLAGFAKQSADAKSKPTLGKLWKDLDEDGSGELTKDEFIEESMRIAPIIHREEAANVFDLMDISGDGQISREEFDIIMSGMTFAGQDLDGQTATGALLRKTLGKTEIEKQRKATARLAMLLEDKRGHDAAGNSERKRRARAAVSHMLTKRVRELRQAKAESPKQGKKQETDGKPHGTFQPVKPAPLQNVVRPPPVDWVKPPTKEVITSEL